MCRDLALNNFVRIFHDVGGGTGGIFSSRYICTSREQTEPSDESENDLDIDVEDHLLYCRPSCGSFGSFDSRYSLLSWASLDNAVCRHDSTS